MSMYRRYTHEELAEISGSERIYDSLTRYAATLEHLYERIEALEADHAGR